MKESSSYPLSLSLTPKPVLTLQYYIQGNTISHQESYTHYICIDEQRHERKNLLSSQEFILR